MKRNIGDKIKIPADNVLGTEETLATIVEVKEYGYEVIMDDDPEEWVGPVDFDGRILQHI